jgi:membrane protein DedA with SNARE-associated domain
MTVENLTNGAFKKSMLMYAVSIGVATGLGVGVLKVIYGWQLPYILIPGYLLLLVVTYLSSEEFVNVGWDSAGVTTGPVTVPLVLAMGVGLGNAVNAVEGFGILALASLFPILSVLTLGLYVKWRNRKVEAEG